MSTATGPSTEAQAGAALPLRLGVFAYGVVSYGVGVAALLAWIGFMLGVLPFGGGPVHLDGAAAVVFDLCLMLAFGVQHSVMARPAFKRWWTRVIPPSAERSTYVLATGLVLLPMLWLWQPMPTTIWHVANPVLAWALTGIALLGWAYLFAASFAIDHFELFGLQQVWRQLRESPPADVDFEERWMYRFDRHPIMTGALIGMWVTPHMQLDHLLFAVMATVYLVIGVYFEERSLLAKHGETYASYKRRVRSIVPTL